MDMMARMNFGLKYVMTNLLVAVIATFGLSLVSLPKASAQVEHQLLRRLVVFPLKVQGVVSTEGAADDAWWQARERFTQNRRFLVASKQFLVKSDVFQPRGELEPADVVILGKLLDAHALVTFELQERALTMRVFDAGTGLTLWRRSVLLHPSIRIQDQLSNLSRKMVEDFIAGIPYQGFTNVDAIRGRAVFEEGDIKLAQVDLGSDSGAKVGDVVQWIRIEANAALPMFQGGAKVRVFAEGRIVKIDDGHAVVEIIRAPSGGDVAAAIKGYSLVRVPREADRLLSEYAISETPKTSLSAELVAPEAGVMQPVRQERKPLMATLSWVGSLAAMLLLAF